MKRFNCCLITLLSLAASFAFANIRNVPAQYGTIQAAIDAADEADTVLVAPGNYRRSISLEGKSLTIASHFLIDGHQESIDSTILDCQSRRRGMTIIETGVNRVCIKGFTITNGFSSYGAGIYANDSRILLEDIKINKCSATGQENSGAGGGIYCTNNSDALIQRITVDACTSYYGGGIGTNGSVALIENVSVTGSIAQYFGGGIYCYQSEVEVNDSKISSNSSEFCSALFGSESEINVNRTLINDNRHWRFGQQTFATIKNKSSIMIFDHVTICNNGPINGTDIGLLTNENGEMCFVSLRNSILWHGAIRSEDENGTVFIEYCIADPDHVELPAESVHWQGNINADPGLNEDFGPANMNSLCVDAGDPEFSRDADGTRNDIGAYYYPQGWMLIEPEIIRFEQMEPGHDSSQNFTISNEGLAALSCTIPPGGLDEPFDIDWGGDTLIVMPGESRQFAIRFAPLVGGYYSDTLVIYSDSRYFPEISIQIFAEALEVPLKSNLSQLPSTFSLSAFPNPFNSSTTISFSVGAQGLAPVRLAIYDLSGRLVTDLLGSTGVSAGQHKVVWNAGDLPAGVYLVKLTDGFQHISKKVVVIR